MGREEDTEHALQLLTGVVTLLDPVRLRIWAEHGLTVPTLKVLFLLRDNPGMPAGMLAQRLSVTPSTITGLVDRLVAQGLVRREEDARDRRLVCNYLTMEGLSLAGDVQRQAREIVLRILDALDDEQLRFVRTALEQLLAAAQRVEVRDRISV